MKTASIIVLAAFAATALLQGSQADARRLGGGGNFGAQRSIAPMKPAAPAPSTPGNNAVAQPGTPGAPAATPARPATPSAAPSAAPAPSGMSRWLGPIAGIAAGLGLAALLSHFGLPEGMGSILLIALVIFAGFALVRMFMARRQQPNAPLQYAGAGASATPAAASPTVPTWRIPSTSELDGARAAPAAPDVPEFGVTRKALPQGFDAVTFAREAKRQYIEIQRWYDAADRKALASVMPAEMAAEIGRELDGRGVHQATEIVSLDTDVLDVSTEGDKYWVSVRFTGMVREDGESLAHAIDEVWNLTKPVKGGSGWLLAGISQLA
ncbi:MAG: Tim44-like domain-containing protein [Casimicrobiaceae bacterium]